MLLAYDTITLGFIVKVACSYIGEMPSESRQVIWAYVFQGFWGGLRSGVLFEMVWRAAKREGTLFT